MPAFYRIISTIEPTLADFLSDQARGKPTPTNPDKERYWQGFSVFATEAQARRKARGIPVLGTAIAELDIPSAALEWPEGDLFARDPPFYVERSLKSSGHYTMWGDPSVLLKRVQSVVPVDPGANESEPDHGLRAMEP
jgi:hypothetical protein